MKKKLTEHDKKVVLVFDKKLLKLMKAEKGTTVDISFDGESLIITPEKPKIKRRSKQTEKKIDEIASRIMDKYDAAFKKLAKT